jgi:hypothetical protein
VHAATRGTNPPLGRGRMNTQEPPRRPLCCRPTPCRLPRWPCAPHAPSDSRSRRYPGPAWNAQSLRSRRPIRAERVRT